LDATDSLEICRVHVGLLQQWRNVRSFENFRNKTSGHLCMALLRLPMKFGADIFIQSGVIDIFQN